MAYQIHDVANGDVIQAQTTIEQDTQIAANESAIGQLQTTVQQIQQDMPDTTQIESDVSALQTSVSGLTTTVNGINTTLETKMNEPTNEGTNGQVLTTDGNGNRTWTTVQGGGGSSVEIDDTLTQQGEAADAKAAGDALATKLTKPATDGTNGQVLVTDGQGGVAWNDALDSTAVESAVGSYINAHPEVIAVADGSITRAKLDMKLGEVADTVAEYNDTLKEDVDLTDTTMYFRRTGYIDDTGVFRKTSGTTTKHVYIPIICGTPRTIVVEGNADEDTYIAFTSNPTSTNGTAVSFAGDYTSRITITAGSVNKFEIPENTTYIYIYLGGSTEAQVPTRIYFIQEAKINDYKAIEAFMDGDWVTGLDTTMSTQHQWWADGVVTNTGYTRTLAVTPGQHVRITNNTSHSSNHMLLRESLENTGVGNPLNGRPVVYLNTNNNVGRVDDFYVPDGFYYLSVFDHQDGAAVSNRWPTSVQVMKIGTSSSSGDGSGSAVQTMTEKDDKRIDSIGLTPINQTDSDGWELPNTVQQMNVVRKSNRFRFLPWTPLRDIPTRQGSTSREDGGFSPAGTAFTRGIPYSSNWQDYKYVGITVSTYTFLTAVHNPYSLPYTETLRHTNPLSAWGRKWIVGNGTNYYGLVCCGFTAAATKSELVWNNGQIPYVNEFVAIDRAEDLDLNLLRVGDVMNNDAHATVIYAIKRDVNNNVTNIRICQSGGSFWGEDFNSFTADGFKSAYSGDGWIAYRYKNLYKNTDYVPEDTDMDEINQILDDTSTVTFSHLPTYTNEICTFAGDKASFALGAVGHLIVINYNLDGNSMGTYDRIRLYNVDDTTTPVGEWTVAQANATLDGVWDSVNRGFSTDNYPSVDMTNHAVVVSTATNPLTAGKYYAVLSDGTTDSTDMTEFEVIDNGITSVEDNGDYYKFMLQDNIVACYLGTLNPNDGDPAFSGSIKHELAREEEVNKYLLVNKSDLAGVATNDLYIRLHTKGDYGTACVVKKVFN